MAGSIPISAPPLQYENTVAASLSPEYASPPQDQILQSGEYPFPLVNGAPRVHLYSNQNIQAAVANVFGSADSSGSAMSGINRLAASPRSFEMVESAPHTPEEQVYNAYLAADNLDSPSSVGSFDSPMRAIVAAADYSPIRHLGAQAGSTTMFGVSSSLLEWAMTE